MDNQQLVFNYDRRFGVEIEVNSLDGRDYVNLPLHSGELPLGIDYIATLLKENLKKSVLINKWSYTHNNDDWVLKPDSSCGIEICSPVSKRWAGLREICQVIELLKNDTKITADHRCSLHVHVEVADLSTSQLNKVLAYWIKCEAVFLDAMPDNRKVNRYCQCIGETDAVNMGDGYDELYQKLGSYKYLTVNTYHYCKSRRKTIEFRIIGNEGCKNPYLVKNWIRLLIHFIEQVRNMSFPTSWKKGDKWSSYAWLDVRDVFDILGFSGQFSLSKGLEQTRNWFLANLSSNLNSLQHQGVWSPAARIVSRQQVDDLASEIGLDLNQYLAANDSETLYSENLSK